MQRVIMTIRSVAAFVYKRGRPAYEATTVGTSIQKLFASLPNYTQTRGVVAYGITNTDAAKYIYVTWVPAGDPAPTTSEFSATKYRDIVKPLEGANCFQFESPVDFYILGSDTGVTYVAQEFVS